MSNILNVSNHNSGTKHDSSIEIRISRFDKTDSAHALIEFLESISTEFVDAVCIAAKRASIERENKSFELKREFDDMKKNGSLDEDLEACAVYLKRLKS